MTQGTGLLTNSLILNPLHKETHTHKTQGLDALNKYVVRFRIAEEMKASV